jgi:stage II sporulation protein AB (anti-sigma F factor)
MIVKPVPVTSFSLPARAASVARGRNWLRAFAGEHGADSALKDRLTTATSEVLSNVVVHAYPGRLDGAMHVSADIEDDTLEVVVADDGTGLRASRSDEVAAGLGLTLLARSTDSFAMRERVPQGVEVWMRFRLAPEGGER